MDNNKLVNQSLGNNLKFRRILNSFDNNIIKEQNDRLKKLFNHFFDYINQDKIRSVENYSKLFLSSLNIQLFGYLGSIGLYETVMDEFPFRDHLIASKTLFYKDLKSMADVVNKWTIKGNKITILDNKNEQICFKADDESLNFFKTLRDLNTFFYKAKEPALKSFGFDILAYEFGTYPAEKIDGYNIDKNNRRFWRPEETAQKISDSIKNENTISLVIECLLKTKSLFKNIIIDRVDYKNDKEDVRNIKNIEYFKRDAKISFINGMAYSQNYNLKVENVYKAEAFNREIPEEKYQAIENFIELNKENLKREIPFILTPEFFVLEGPVRKSLYLIPDPIIILQFKEFPGTLIPIEAWLMTKNELLDKIEEINHINTFDINKVIEVTENKTVFEKIGPLTKEMPLLKKSSDEIKNVIKDNTIV